MLVFALETSCDETAAAVVQNGTNVLSSTIASSKDTFATLGGVVPEEAARKQIESILPILNHTLSAASITIDDVDAIAVTRGPGLFGSLLAGTICARTLASVWNKPLIPVHHTLGHIVSTQLECTDTLQYPILTLSASGGHTDLWLRTSSVTGTLLGSTRDDAAGEAFDKGAMLLELPYPGGPSIAKAAEQGNKDAYTFPLPLKQEDGYDFSFSGLKTALRYTIRDHPQATTEDLAASFQEALCNHLLDRLSTAVKNHSSVQEIHIVGGVSANTRLQEKVNNTFGKTHTVRTPKKLQFCTDNAAMIATAGYLLWQELGEAACTTFETSSTLPLTIAMKANAKYDDGSL